MTAPMCLPGTSRVVAGFDPTQILLGDAIGDALVLLGMPELAAVFASVGVLQFALGAVCNQDPPALPTIDAAKIAAYYNSLSADAYPLILRDAQDLVGHYLWWQWCECVGAPTPSPPAPLPLPPGVDLDRQPVPFGSGGECYSAITAFEGKSTDASGDVTWDITPTLSNVVGASTQFFAMTIGNAEGTINGPYPVTNYVDQVDAAGGVLETHARSYASAPVRIADEQFALPRNPAAAKLQYRSHYPGGPTAVGCFFEARQHCTAVPPQLRPDCCPPDPELENLILQVLRLEQLILQSLGGSTAYTRGTSHLGLTGSGSLSVAGLRGVAVAVTAGTPTNPLLPGNPPYQWDLGWMSILTGDGMIEERRLTRQTQVWLPASMPLALSFGYFLFPGVVATITELVPA